MKTATKPTQATTPSLAERIADRFFADCYDELTQYRNGAFLREWEREEFVAEIEAAMADAG